jgi:ABC-2 type transport system permease protein
VAVVLLLLINLAWRRGSDTSLWARAQLARDRFTRTMGPALVSALALALTAALGGFVYYQIQFVNQAPHFAYLASETSAVNLAENPQQLYNRYLSRYAPYADAQPTALSVHADVDVQPADRSFASRFQYTLENRTSGPVTDILINERAEPPLTDVRLDRTDVTTALDRVPLMRVYHFHLGQPLAPGEQVPLLFGYQKSTPPGFDIAAAPAPTSWPMAQAS